MQSRCWDDTELNGDHTAESLREAFNEMYTAVRDHIAEVTTDSDSNNKDLFYAVCE